MVKDSDAHVRFTFLTGISKFSKVNLFSQLNNLTDLTLDRRYSSICDKYRGRGEPIHLIGVELSRHTRNVTAFELADA